MTSSVTDIFKNRLFLLGLAAISIIYIAFTASHKQDFSIFLSASNQLVKESGNIYSNTFKDGYHYYYSVLFALLIYPFNLLPLYAATFIWLLLNLFLLYRIIRIIGRYFNLNALSPTQQWMFVLLCFVTSIKFTIQNIDCHQVTILILYLTLEGLEQIFSGKKTWGAFLIAFAINIKLLPVLFIFYLIYRKEFKASIFILLFYVILLELPALLLGTDMNNKYITDWWHLINPNDPQQVIDSDEGGNFHSLITLLSTLLVKQPHLPDAPATANWTIVDLTVQQFQYVILAVRLLFASFTLYFLRTLPFKASTSNMHRFWEISYLLIITPLIFPHQPFYAYLFAVPAICYIYYYLLTHKQIMTKTKFNISVILLTLSFLLCNIRFIIGAIDGYSRYLKFPVYGVLLLVVVLALFKVEKEKPELS